MLIEIWQIVIGALSAALIGAGSAVVTVLVRSRAQKIKEIAEAGISEVDLKKAMTELEAMADEADQKQIRSYLEELQELRPKVRALLDENVALAEKCAELELKGIEWMRRALIAEKKNEFLESNPPCSVLNCFNRLPPLEAIK